MPALLGCPREHTLARRCAEARGKFFTKAFFITDGKVWAVAGMMEKVITGKYTYVVITLEYLVLIIR
jgi:hypothetical protein